MARKYDLVICGYYGFDNLGDELICLALIEMALEAGLKKDRICVLSSDPRKTKSRFGVASVNRWNILEVLNALRQSRSFLLGGGGLFQDSTSLRSSLYYWGVVLLAQVAGAVPWAFGQSVGPLNSKAARMLARDALRRCRVRFVRDEASKKLLASLGLDSKIAPDPVFYLKFDKLDKEVFKKTLVFNVRPTRDDKGMSKLLVQNVELFAKMHEYDLRAICMSEEDLLELKRLESFVKFDDVVVPKDLKDAILAFEGATAAVGMRLHFCILALMNQVPVIAVPYDPKVRSFASKWNIPLWEGEGDLDRKITGIRKAKPEEIATARKTLQEAFFLALRTTLGDEKFCSVSLN